MSIQPPQKIIYVQPSDPNQGDTAGYVVAWGIVAIVLLKIGIDIYVTVEGWYRATVVWLTETRNSISMAVDEWYNWLTEAGIAISATVGGWYHAFVAWLSETGAYIASFWPF